ncbi:hypothetical protein C8R44DRAFT_947587 [Mycena epipterygia]|nr:hypothetical protein C8R44DRAFT_947587 [Mycena epipterygia]
MLAEEDEAEAPQRPNIKHDATDAGAGAASVVVLTFALAYAGEDDPDEPQIERPATESPETEVLVRRVRDRHAAVAETEGCSRLWGKTVRKSFVNIECAALRSYMNWRREKGGTHESAWVRPSPSLAANRPLPPVLFYFASTAAFRGPASLSVSSRVASRNAQTPGTEGPCVRDRSTSVSRRGLKSARAEASAKVELGGDVVLGALVVVLGIELGVVFVAVGDGIERELSPHFGNHYRAETYPRLDCCLGTTSITSVAVKGAIPG